jgi:proteic killer suppression protein
VITGFRHKGLRRYHETGSLAGIQPRHASRLRILLAALESSHVIGDMDIPGLRLHALKGVQRGRWSVWVDGNWRLTFGFHGGHAHAVDYEDYH